MKRVITFGTYDLFHLGHLRLLKRAAELGDELIVGVSTDSLNFSKKKKYPVFPLKDRLEIVESLKVVTQVFREESLELKGEYIKRFKANTLVMGDDWQGKFDQLNNLCEVIYLPRTPEVSTTGIKEYLANGMSVTLEEAMKQEIR